MKKCTHLRFPVTVLRDRNIGKVGEGKKKRNKRAVAVIRNDFKKTGDRKSEAINCESVIHGMLMG